MVAYISSALSNYCISLYNNDSNITKELPPVNIYKDYDSINVNISKDALESLDSEKNSFVLDYTSPNVLEDTGCETIEQLKYINTRGLGAQKADDFRDYIKIFHFMPVLGYLSNAGINDAADIGTNVDDILKNLDVSQLIEINEKINEYGNIPDTLNAFSEIFEGLADIDNLTSDLSNKLLKLSDLFDRLAQKALELNQKEARNFSVDRLIKLLDDENGFDKTNITSGQQKFNSLLITKYQK